MQNQRRQRLRFGSELPATPCTPAVREAMEKIADSRNTTLAEIQREAVDLYLSQKVSKPEQKRDKLTSDLAHGNVA